MNTSALFRRAGFHTRQSGMGRQPTLKIPLIAFVLACGLLTVCAPLGVTSAMAAGIVVTDPITNEVGVDIDADISAGFSAAISSTTVTTQTFVVHGTMSGRRDGAYSYDDGDNTETFDPAVDFFPGEVVRTSVTSGVSDTLGSPLVPYQWQFTAGPVRPYCFRGFVDIEAGLLEMYEGAANWGDYDNDGDLDFLLAGYDSGYQRIARVYRNNGNGTFTDIAAGLVGVGDGTAAWGDYDNDGDLDILLTGGTGSGGIVSKIYHNDDGTFTDIGASLQGTYSGVGRWGDFDNDGDLDILLTGNTGSTRIARIYRNDGGGSFMGFDIDAGLPGVDNAACAVGDYDNDGDLDVLLSGYSGSANVSRVYRNDGNLTFTNSGASLSGAFGSAVAWGDYDNDGYLDIVLTGNPTAASFARVYHNQGDGTFEIAADLPGLFRGSAAWGDYDNDGDLDLLLTGKNSSSGYDARVYRNDRGSFNIENHAGLPGVWFSSGEWGDYDNDGHLDILLMGLGSTVVTGIYRNEKCDYYYLPTMYKSYK